MPPFWCGSHDTAGSAFCRLSWFHHVLFLCYADIRGKNSHGTRTLSEMTVQNHRPGFLKDSARRRAHIRRGGCGNPDVFLLFRAIRDIVVMFFHYYSEMLLHIPSMASSLFVLGILFLFLLDEHVLACV